MIDLRGRRPAKPPELDHHPDILAARARIQAVVDGGQAPGTRDFPDCWKGYKHVFAAAQGQGKCAYCESRIRSAEYGKIDHYRPKAAVVVYDDPGRRDDVMGQSPQRRIQRRTQPGYWWLAYDWDNWLYACERCNTWKGDQFPVRGRRRPCAPGVEAAETARLLNPFDTDPAPHFGFDESGHIHGATRAGRDTIDVCGLDRDTLVYERGRVAGALRKLVDDYELAAALSRALAERMVAQMHAYCRDDAPYAGMCRYLLRAWAGRPGKPGLPVSGTSS
jgi:5-methylcytosine-specific restriction endonuclease McrA